MKALNKLAIVFLILSFLWACDTTQSGESNRKAPPNDGKNLQFVFNPQFSTQLSMAEPTAQCPSPSVLILETGSGNESRLGNFTFTATRCQNSQTGIYQQMQGTFRTNNGDELHIGGFGRMRASKDPAYDMELNDPIEIVGGTGRFLGATGAGTAQGLISLQHLHADHKIIAKYNITFK